MVKLLYYAREVDTILLVDMVSVSDNQANRNETTAQAIKQLLDYCVTHLDDTIHNKESDIVLCVHSCGSYLS